MDRNRCRIAGSKLRIHVDFPSPRLGPSRNCHKSTGLCVLDRRRDCTHWPMEFRSLEKERRLAHCVTLGRVSHRPVTTPDSIPQRASMQLKCERRYGARGDFGGAGLGAGWRRDGRGSAREWRDRERVCAGARGAYVLRDRFGVPRRFGRAFPRVRAAWDGRAWVTNCPCGCAGVKTCPGSSVDFAMANGLWTTGGAALIGGTAGVSGRGAVRGVRARRALPNRGADRF